MPTPTETVSLTRHDTDGLTLIVLMSDLTPWKRPSQLLSYSVRRPNGALMPMPTAHCELIGMAAYRFGMTARSPASPPVPPSGWNAAGCEPPSLNLNLSLIHISEPTRLLSISYAVFCLKK